MFVSRSMTRKVITVAPDDGIFKAQELMAEHTIRHLPVTLSFAVLAGFPAPHIEAQDIAEQLALQAAREDLRIEVEAALRAVLLPYAAGDYASVPKLTKP